MTYVPLHAHQHMSFHGNCSSVTKIKFFFLHFLDGAIRKKKCCNELAAGREAGNWNRAVIHQKGLFGTTDLLDRAHLKLWLSFSFLHTQPFLQRVVNTLGEGGVSHRKRSLSRPLCLFCFLLSLVVRFSQIVSALKPSAVGHRVSQHLKRQTLEWSALECILRFAPYVCCFRTWAAPLFDLMISVSELDWQTATDLTFTQSWMEWNETLEYTLLFSVPCKVWSALWSFQLGAFLRPVAGPSSASPLSLSPSFLSDFICRCHPSSQHLTFLHLLSSVLHFSSISSCFSATTSSLASWLCSLNPLTHWVQHACKGWC